MKHIQVVNTTDSSVDTTYLGSQYNRFKSYVLPSTLKGLSNSHRLSISLTSLRLS